MTQDLRDVMELTVNEAVRLYPQTIAVFNEYGIDACCGGAARIADAATRDGADPAAVESALRRVLEAGE